MSAEVRMNSLHFIRDFIFPITERETVVEFKAEDFTGPYLYSSGAAKHVNAISEFVEEQRKKQIDSLFHFVRLRAYHDECKTVFSLYLKKNLVEGLCNILHNPYIQIKGKIKGTKRNIFPVVVDRRFDLQEIMTCFKQTRTNEHNEQFSVERKDNSKKTTSFFEFDVIVGWSSSNLPTTPRKGNPSQSKCLTIKFSPNSSLQNLYDDESTKDLKIVCGNGAEIKCHKIIFTERSNEALSALVTPPSKPEIKESDPEQKGRIEMKDESEEVVRHLLQYLYGRELSTNNMNCDVAIELLMAADKFNLVHLQHSIFDLLLLKSGRWFTPGTVLELYCYVKRFNEYAKLEKHSLRILSGMDVDHLRSCQGFKKLDDAEAINLLCKLIKSLQKQTTTSPMSD